MHLDVLRKSSRKGFTFTELLVVLALIGVSSSLMAIGLRSDAFSNATRMVFSDLLYAKGKAISEKNDVQVLFRPDSLCPLVKGQDYLIHLDENRNGKCERGEEVVGGQVSNYFPGLKIHASVNVTFNPLGMATPCIITLSSRKDAETEYGMVHSGSTGSRSPRTVHSITISGSGGITILDDADETTKRLYTYGSDHSHGCPVRRTPDDTGDERGGDQG